MPSEWYVRVNGRVHGPFDDRKLVQLASSGKIQGSTEIARSQTGPWHAAQKLKGLNFPTSGSVGSSSEVARQQAINVVARDELKRDTPAEESGTPQANRAMGYGLLLSGAMCVFAGLTVGFLLTSVFGGRTRFVAYGAIGSGIGMFVAGLLNVLTGKNLADIQLLPDASNSSIGVQIVAALAKVIITLILLAVMGWIAFAFLLK